MILDLFPEPDPDVEIDEYAAQAVLRRHCPVCHATPGFSCTYPVEIDFPVERLPADMPGFEGTSLALESLTRPRSVDASSGGVS